MKINTNNKRVKKYVIIAAILLAVIFGYIAVAYTIKSYPFNNRDDQTLEDSTSKKVNEVNYDKPSSDQEQAGIQAKKEAEERELDPGISTPEGATHLAITSHNQQNGLLELRTTISTTDESGRCILTFKKSGSTTITQEVGVQNMGSYSVCKGFDINTTGLAKGEWMAEIKYADSTSSVVSQAISVE